MSRKTEFVCENCGYCCTEVTTQINLTLLDLKWLSDYMKLSIKELFEKDIVSFVPFINEEDFSRFNAELGMKKPCKLRKKSICSVYDARPLNCRTFPYWLINHNIEDESLSCIKNIEPDLITKTRYMEYERMVGKILLLESEKTDAFMKKIGATQAIDMSKDDEFKKLEKGMKKIRNKKKIIEITARIIKIAEKKIGKKLLEKVPLIEKEIKKQSWDEKIDMLIAAEVLLEGVVTNFQIKNA